MRTDISIPIQDALDRIVFRIFRTSCHPEAHRLLDAISPGASPPPETPSITEQIGMRKINAKNVQGKVQDALDYASSMRRRWTDAEILELDELVADWHTAVKDADKAYSKEIINKEISDYPPSEIQRLDKIRAKISKLSVDVENRLKPSADIFA